MEIMHFNSTKERLDYLRGGFEEIKPIEATKEVETTEEKPKKGEKNG